MFSDRLVVQIRGNILAGRMPGRYVAALADAVSLNIIALTEEKERSKSKTNDTRERFITDYVAPEDRQLFRMS